MCDPLQFLDQPFFDLSKLEPPKYLAVKDARKINCGQRDAKIVN
jgi:hypothetical protein